MDKEKIQSLEYFLHQTSYQINQAMRGNGEGIVQNTINNRITDALIYLTHAVSLLKEDLEAKTQGTNDDDLIRAIESIED